MAFCCFWSNVIHWSIRFLKLKGAFCELWYYILKIGVYSVIFRNKWRQKRFLRWYLIKGVISIVFKCLFILTYSRTISPFIHLLFTPPSIFMTPEGFCNVFPEYRKKILKVFFAIQQTSMKPKHVSFLYLSTFSPFKWKRGNEMVIEGFPQQAIIYWNFLRIF